MKIAIVIENFNPSAGGNERSTSQIARLLSERGHEVVIITNSAANLDQLPKAVSVVARNGSKTSRAWGLMGFRRWSKKRLIDGGFDVSLSMTLAVPADVMQLRGGTIWETLRQNIAMRKGVLRKCLKFISIITSLKQLLLLRFESTTLNSSDVKCVVAISQYVADQLFCHYTYPAKRIALIPNAAEVKVPEAEVYRQIRTESRALLGLNEGAVGFLFAAMNPRLKGFDALIAAMKRVTKENDRAVVVVAGTMDKTYVKHVESMGLSQRVRFIGKTNEMDALYIACDVLVHPTYYDPSSKVVLESLLHGKPAITTRYNGASQWVYDPHGQMKLYSPLIAPNPMEGHTFDAVIPAVAGALITSPDDVEDLARAIVKLCDDDVRRSCSEATVVLSEHITMTKHVDALEKLFVELIQKKDGDYTNADGCLDDNEVVSASDDGMKLKQPLSISPTSSD